MAGRKGVALASPPDDSQDEKAEAPKYVLRLGDQEFTCKDELPISTYTRYLNESEMVQIHHMLNRTVVSNELKAMWDAAEELPWSELRAAYYEMVWSYSGGRPTKRPAS